jgi:hypothetical protein
VQLGAGFEWGSASQDEDPISKILYAYREYRPYKHGGGGTRTARQHVEALLAGEPKIPYAVGGAKSAQNWREEFRAAGNTSSVEVGISRVYAAISRGELVFIDDLEGILDELQAYSRKLDERGDPTDEIEDKSCYHGLDALRYVVGHNRRPMDARWQIGLPPEGQGGIMANELRCRTSDVSESLLQKVISPLC